jgi:hypothetical protein
MDVQDKKKCEYCGKDIFRVKESVDSVHGNRRVAWGAWKKVRFCSMKCKIKGTKGEDWTKGKKGRFKKGQTPWNKGKRTSKIREKYGGGSDAWSKHLRSKPETYLQELRENAIRAKELGYHSTEHHRAQTKARAKEIIEACGIHGMQPWQGNELDFLKDNFRKMTLWEIALKLQRSYSSVTHKADRLELKQYNKWINTNND